MRKVLALICIVLVASVVCFCFVGCNEKTDFTVGIIQLAPHPALDAATQGFRDALESEMEKAGKTVKIDYQNASGETTVCTTIASKFVGSKVDLIMANATPALQAAMSATTTIPILGTSVTEYGIALGIDDFTGVVGGNVSGTSDLAPLDTQAQMMVDLLPNAKKIALFYCSAEANSKYQVDKVKKYLEGLDLGITADVKTFSDTNDIASVANGIVGDGYQAVYIPTDNTAANNTSTIDNIFGAANIPVFAGEEGICEGCGFATYSISYYNIGWQTGLMAAKILLENADISTMAIQADPNPVKKYVPERCEALGITVPEDYVAIE